MAEKSPRRNADDVLYVYDRICCKSSKRKQILKEYGNTASAKNVHNYSYGKSFAEKQKERAAAYSEAHPYYRKRRQAEQQRANSVSYGYKPPSSRNYGGGEAVRDKPLKIIIEHIINLFDTIEERGKADERIAKQRAIAKKRFYDHRNTIFTVLIVAAMVAAFIFAVYKFAFVIDTIEISGSEKYEDSEILTSSGISVGDNLYSFDKEVVENDITFRCAYIKSADITRTVPKSVEVLLEEDSAMYFANIWGEYLVLSPGLRVLDSIERGQAKEEGLVELVLPPVSDSVCGKVVKFVSSRDDRFIRTVLDEITASALYNDGMINQINFSDEFGITMQAESKYLLKLGGEADCDLKLRMAHRAITDIAKENDSPAKIDLTNVGSASVRFDRQLKFD